MKLLKKWIRDQILEETEILNEIRDRLCVTVHFYDGNGRMVSKVDRASHIPELNCHVDLDHGIFYVEGKKYSSHGGLVKITGVYYPNE